MTDIVTTQPVTLYEQGVYVEVHPGNGPYMLMVHGMLSSRANWRPNLPALAAVSRPVVIELYGHGRSASPTNIDDYSHESYIRTFERIRTRLGASRWLLCGHSLGASITLRYAFDHPDHIAGHIVTNSNIGFGLISAPSNHDIEDYAQQLVRDWPAIRDGGSRHPARKWMAADVREELIADVALHNPAGLANTVRRTVRYGSMGDRLGENAVPTLLIAGVRETRFNEARSHLAQVMPMLDVVEVDAGHIVSLQAPDAFNRAATAFIRRLNTTSDD